MPTTSPDVEVAVLNSYARNLSARQIARLLPVSASTVLNILVRNAVARRPRSRPPKYALNEDYFERIDTEEKAYWLGFVAADGCVAGTKLDPEPRNFIMGLAELDAEHLETFRRAIGYAGPITVRRQKGRTRGIATLSVGRKRFVTHLVSHGIVPNKTSLLRPPGEEVPAELRRHWWRGMIDGDGSIYTGRNSRSGQMVWRINLCGTPAVIVGFCAFVREYADINLSLTDKGMVWTASLSGIQYPQLVARLLYGDAMVYLPRKKRLADELLAVNPQRPRFLTLGGKVQSIKQTAASHGVAQSTIRGRFLAGMSLEDAVTTPNKNPRRLLTHQGQTRTVNEWARRLGINHQTIHERLKRGDSPEDALRPV